MKQFFKTLLASVLGLFLGSFLIIILFIIIIVSFSGGGEESFNTKENSVLYMTLNQKMVDNASNGILDHIEIPGMNDQKKLGLNDLTSSLKRAKTDDNIKGIYLDLSSNPGGLGTIEEIRNAIIDFKESTSVNRYKITTTTVVPRPMALVTALSLNGQVNTALFSQLIIFSQHH